MFLTIYILWSVLIHVWHVLIWNPSATGVKLSNWWSYCININTSGLVIHSFEISFGHMGPPSDPRNNNYNGENIFYDVINLLLYILAQNDLIICDTDRILEFWLHILNLHEKWVLAVYDMPFSDVIQPIPFLVIITKDDQLGYCKGYEPDMKKPSSYMESPSNFTSDNI